MFNGLTNVNIELSSRCNKKCHMCTRRQVERDTPELAKWGDMDFELVKSISRQIPAGVVCQFHDNGEPLLYPRLGEALHLFEGKIRCLDTNGKLLIEKAGEIIDNLETITISTFEGDDEADEQYNQVWNFWRMKGNRKPNIIIRCLGDTMETLPYRNYKAMGFLTAHRQFHSSEGNYDYQRQPVIPEIGICLLALSHLVIKWDGSVAMCVSKALDLERKGVIGNIKDNTLDELWNGAVRQKALQNHIRGERDKNPLCKDCDYWGYPRA